MDWDLLKIVLTLAQAAKEWPLTTLIVVCITALFAIPVAMVTKRWLDMTWLNRDSYIAMLAEHKGRLQKEVEEWRRTAENALAGERRLIDQMSGLQKSLGDAQKQLTEAREKEESLVKTYEKRILEWKSQALIVIGEERKKLELAQNKELKLKERIRIYEDCLRKMVANVNWSRMDPEEIMYTIGEATDTYQLEAGIDHYIDCPCEGRCNGK